MLAKIKGLLHYKFAILNILLLNIFASTDNPFRTECNSMWKFYLSYKIKMKLITEPIYGFIIADEFTKMWRTPEKSQTA